MPLKANRIKEIINKMGKARIVILGDIMLDEYLIGMVTRISPEAPVPVVEVTSDKFLLGGAANVAANIRALGDEPILLGTVGEDEASVKLCQILKEKDIRNETFLSQNKGTICQKKIESTKNTRTFFNTGKRSCKFS